MGRALVYVVPIALAIYALIDLSRSTAQERSGVPTAAWVAIVVLLPVLGPIAWVVVSRNARSQTAGGSGPAGPTRPGRGPARPSGPRAPDDDPEFLWRLERDRRRAAGSGHPDASGGPTEDPDGPALPGEDAGTAR